MSFCKWQIRCTYILLHIHVTVFNCCITCCLHASQAPRDCGRGVHKEQISLSRTIMGEQQRHSTEAEAQKRRRDLCGAPRVLRVSMQMDKLDGQNRWRSSGAGEIAWPGVTHWLKQRMRTLKRTKHCYEWKWGILELKGQSSYVCTTHYVAQ